MYSACVPGSSGVLAVRKPMVVLASSCRQSFPTQDVNAIILKGARFIGVTLVVHDDDFAG